jgi:prolipoprotein diacylglyceryltransferase
VASLSFVLIRLGNLINSEILGIPTDLPWGFIFTSVDNIPRHPAQLYEAIHYLVVFLGLFLAWFKQKDTMKDGFLFGWALIVLFTIRFVAEFFKMDQVEFEEGMILNMGQILSIPFILTGIVLLILNFRKKPGSIPNEKIALDV